MARLTIRQASQQGFASTLTIHRHIKEGSLPVYEEGDAKLLEVDDLIALFGEPGLRPSERQPAPPNGRVDIHEYNRMKAELEQKNRKNMWLAADLAEVVRELKEKEAKFEKERNRLLTVLEQAQALLLREAGRSGGTKRAPTEAAPAPKSAPADSESEPAVVAPLQPADTPAAPAVASEFETPLVLEIPATPATDDSAPAPPSAATAPAKTVTAGLPPIPPEGEVPPEHIVLPEHKDSINPLIPPLEDPSSPRRTRRVLGATTWLLLCALAGGGLVFFEFRTQVLTGVHRVLQALS